MSKPKPNTHVDPKELLEERGSTHGAFSENARISQALEDIARTSKNWDSLTPVQKEAIKLLFHKTARFLSGNSKFIDCPKDMIGYIQLMLDEMKTYPGAIDVKQEYIKL